MCIPNLGGNGIQFNEQEYFSNGLVGSTTNWKTQIAPNFAKDIEVIEDKIVCMHGGLSPELGAPGHGAPDL